MPLDPAVLRLLDRVEEDLDDLVPRIVERMRGYGDPDGGYRTLPVEDLRVVVVANVHRALEALREDRVLSDEERTALIAVGELRARQGLTLSTLLLGVRAAGREVLDAATRLSGEAGLDAPGSIALAAALWDWIDELSVELTKGHRQAELAMVRQDQQERAAFVHGLVSGSLSAQKLADGAAAYSLDADAEHHAVRVRPTPEHPVEELELLLHPSRWSPGIVSVVDGDLAAVLPSPPAADIPVAAGVGPPVALAAIGRSFLLASRALETASAFGRSGCHGLEDLSLRAAVLAEDEVGDVLLRRYVTPVRELGAFGEELLRSLRAYLEHDQSIDAAARALHVHPNTLRHRLARFEETTGASLRRAEHLAELWWVLEREDLVGFSA
jgi:hypothetical protein